MATKVTKPAAAASAEATIAATEYDISGLRRLMETR
jgi:hypothetical protein